MSYRIKMLWDHEAAVWIATSQDVPGLVLESGSFDALLERVRHAVPELIEVGNRLEKDSAIVNPPNEWPNLPVES